MLGLTEAPPGFPQHAEKQIENSERRRAKKRKVKQQESRQTSKTEEQLYIFRPRSRGQLSTTENAPRQRIPARYR